MLTLSEKQRSSDPLAGRAGARHWCKSPRQASRMRWHYLLRPIPQPELTPSCSLFDFGQALVPLDPLQGTLHQPPRSPPE